LLHAFSVSLVAFLPVSCCLALAAPPLAIATVVAAIVMPRLSWRCGGSTEGVLFVAALGLYWNVVYATFFLSPLFIAACCWAAPRCGVPATAMYAVLVRIAWRPDLGDGQQWLWFSKTEWAYHAFRRFLGLRLHVSEALRRKPAKEPVILAVHPHGVASDYRILMDGMLCEALPGRKVLTLSASVLFCIPLLRELCLWTGCIDASRPVATRALRRGCSLMVLPGGELEQIRTRAGVEEVCLSTRLGFVKLALQAGAPLVPCYAFGCVDLYSTYSVFFAPREWLRKRLGICIPLYRGSIGALPKRVPVDVVIGDPMELNCATAGFPTDDEVVAAHGAYIAALRELFDTHKERFGCGSRQLVVA